jgi:hypothetical protein
LVGGGIGGGKVGGGKVGGRTGGIAILEAGLEAARLVAELEVLWVVFVRLELVKYDVVLAAFLTAFAVSFRTASRVSFVFMRSSTWLIIQIAASGNDTTFLAC